jgi:hypothetical protein
VRPLFVDGNYINGSTLSYVEISYGGTMVTTTIPTITIDAVNLYMSNINLFRGKGVGIQINSHTGSPLILENSQISNFLSYGVNVGGSFVDIRFQNVVVQNCNDRGINVNHGGSTANKMSVKDSLFTSNNQYGIYFYNPGQFDVFNTKFSNHSNNGLRYDAAGGYYANVRVYDSYFNDSPNNNAWTIDIIYATLDMRNCTVTNNSEFYWSLFSL